MENNTVTKPQPAMRPPHPDELPEFDPFSKAKPCSPFYLYNHDSPRPSTDMKPKQSLNVSVRDLEAGSTNLTPSTTQEKLAMVKSNASTGWRSMFGSQQCQRSMTQPKEKSWLKRMPKKQRTIVKLVIALLIVGCMIGIALGIAAGLHTGVWKPNNQQGKIGR